MDEVRRARFALQKARDALVEGKVERACELALEAARLDPDNTDARELVVDLAERVRKWRAEATLEHKRALKDFDTGNYEFAALRWERILDKAPADLEVARHLEEARAMLAAERAVQGAPTGELSFEDSSDSDLFDLAGERFPDPEIEESLEESVDFALGAQAPTLSMRAAELFEPPADLLDTFDDSFDSVDADRQPGRRAAPSAPSPPRPSVDNVQIFADEARQAVERGDRTEATRLWARVLALAPENREALDFLRRESARGRQRRGQDAPVSTGGGLPARLAIWLAAGTIAILLTIVVYDHPPKALMMYFEPAPTPRVAPWPDVPRATPTPLPTAAPGAVGASPTATAPPPLAAAVTRLQVTADPPGQVRIDGRSMGSTPLTVLGLAPGDHALEVIPSGFTGPVGRTVRLTPSGQHVEHVTVEAARLVAAVTPAATLVIGDRTERPDTLHDLYVPPGRRTVEVTATGYQTWRRLLDVHSGETVFLRLSPRPLGEQASGEMPAPGIVHVRGGGSLMLRVDGVGLGRSDRFTLVLPPGRHVLWATTKGGAPWRAPLDVASGDEIQLAPRVPQARDLLAQTDGPARLHVEVGRAAELLIEGKAVGRGTSFDVPLAAGRHTVEIRAPGSRSWRRLVDVDPGEVLALLPRLAPVD